LDFDEAHRAWRANKTWDDKKKELRYEAFQLGDRVYVRDATGWMRGEVRSLVSGERGVEIEVELEEGSSRGERMWVKGTENFIRPWWTISLIPSPLEPCMYVLKGVGGRSSRHAFNAVATKPTSEVVAAATRVSARIKRRGASSEKDNSTSNRRKQPKAAKQTNINSSQGHSAKRRREALTAIDKNHRPRTRKG